MKNIGLLSHFSLYKKFRNGRLLKVAESNLPFFLYAINPWFTYAKAAAHGVLSHTDKAHKFAHLLKTTFPLPFLKFRLAKYLGRTQPELVRELLGPPSPRNHLRMAFELVGGIPSIDLTQPIFNQPNTVFQTLWDNRKALTAQDRVSSVNALLKITGGSSIQWQADSPIQLAFKLPLSKLQLETRQGPLVTIFVTAYNVSSLVRQSLQSLLNQTHRHLQILVANDASTDDTLAHLQSLATQDSRITLFNLPQNIGTYAAKSLMLLFAKGQYLVCHDADDLAAPNFIERKLQVFTKHPSKVAVISNWFRVDEELRIFPGAVRRFWPLLSINHSSLMLRTDAFKALGGWDVPRVAADTELFERIRLVYGKRAVVHLPEPLTIGSMRTDSLMNDPVVGAIQAQAFRSRVEYREAWFDWHQACQKQRAKPVMPSALSAMRPFLVPETFRVPPSAIARCWQAMLEQQAMKTPPRV